CTTAFFNLTTTYTDRYYFRIENRPFMANRGVTQFLHDEGIDAMDWPARSPGLNPIEHLWDIVSRSIHRCHVSPQTVQELTDAPIQVWEEIPQENIRCLIRSMPRRYSPRSPSIEISGDLKEKESVTITCSAFTPCPGSPPKLTWNLQQHSHNNMEENTDGTFTTEIQETITLSDKHDGYNITCSAKYPVNEGKDPKTAEETKTLSVSYAPKNTSVSISPSGLVSAGEQVNLTCSSRAKPPVSHFIWFKISKDGPMIVSEGEFYSFTVTDGGVYYCVAMNDLGNQSSWINLNDAGGLSPNIKLLNRLR
uniref:vascular cell adhesion protein 1-like n=1 Tax=Semicossyphus pulcher TaxID=241346 RepID=UPI0037E7EBD5